MLAKRQFLRNILMDDDLRRYPELVDFVLSDKALGIATSYLGTVPYLNRIDMLYSTPREGEDLIKSQLFHVDPEGLTQVKFFINVFDVGEPEGPFTVHSGRREHAHPARHPPPASREGDAARRALHRRGGRGGGRNLVDRFVEGARAAPASRSTRRAACTWAAASPPAHSAWCSTSSTAPPVENGNAFDRRSLPRSTRSVAGDRAQHPCHWRHGEPRAGRHGGLDQS